MTNQLWLERREQRANGVRHAIGALEEPTEIAWSVGITTTDRRHVTIGRTVTSLIAAGWSKEDIHVFADGPSKLPSGVKATIRAERTGGWPNWWLSLAELVMLNPRSSVYFMCQDDAVFTQGAKAYIQNMQWPNDCGILSLYTPQKYANQYGLNRVFDAEGMSGAVALAITRDTAVEMISSAYWFEYRTGRRGGKKHLDGAIGTWAQRNNVGVYYHVPSLAQHIGTTSTMHGNVTSRVENERLANTFIKAIEMDPDIEDEPEPSDEALIRPGNMHVAGTDLSLGLLGFNIATGLGYLNRAIVAHLPVKSWLVPKHGSMPMLGQIGKIETHVCPNCSRGKEALGEFLGKINTLIFAELPHFDNLIGDCQRLGIKTVCIPMAEWMPSACRGWPQGVDRWIFPTEDCARQLSHVLNGEKITIKWPIDLTQFPFTRRETCNRFVYVHDGGGNRGRKGGDIVWEASMLAPEIPLTVFKRQGAARRQPNIKWPSHVTIRDEVDDPMDLYSEGDVLIQPSHVEGIGLQLLEGQASGMPLITTDGPPMNTYNPFRVIRASESKVKYMRTVTSYDACPDHLAEIMREVHGTDISQASDAALQYVSQWHNWETAKDTILDFIKS